MKTSRFAELFGWNRVKEYINMGSHSWYLTLLKNITMWTTVDILPSWRTYQLGIHSWCRRSPWYSSHPAAGPCGPWCPETRHIPETKQQTNNPVLAVRWVKMKQEWPQILMYGKTRKFHLRLIFAISADEENPRKLKTSKMFTLVMIYYQLLKEYCITYTFLW